MGYNMEENKQNQIIISLLARMVFGEEKLKQIITRGKRKPKDWVRGYNSCDGTKGVTAIAKIVGVKSPSATPILKNWEAVGIIYNIGSAQKPLYIKLLTLVE